jgi:hypothetical protein
VEGVVSQRSSEYGLNKIVQAKPETRYRRTGHGQNDLAQRPLRGKPQEFSEREQHQKYTHAEQDYFQAAPRCGPIPPSFPGRRSRNGKEGFAVQIASMGRKKNDGQKAKSHEVPKKDLSPAILEVPDHLSRFDSQSVALASYVSERAGLLPVPTQRLHLFFFVALLYKIVPERERCVAQRKDWPVWPFTDST